MCVLVHVCAAVSTCVCVHVHACTCVHACACLLALLLRLCSPPSPCEPPGGSASWDCVWPGPCEAGASAVPDGVASLLPSVTGRVKVVMQEPLMMVTVTTVITSRRKRSDQQIHREGAERDPAGEWWAADGPGGIHRSRRLTTICLGERLLELIPSEGSSHPPLPGTCGAPGPPSPEAPMGTWGCLSPRPPVGAHQIPRRGERRIFIWIAHFRECHESNSGCRINCMVKYQ